MTVCPTLKCAALAGALDDCVEEEEDEDVEETADPLLLSLAPQAIRAPTKINRHNGTMSFFIKTTEPF